MQLVVLGLPVAFCAFVALIVVLPLCRQRARTGRWAVVVRGSSGSVERFVRGWTVGLLLAIAVWTGLVATVDPEELGVWRLSSVLPTGGFAVMAMGVTLVVIAQAQMGTSWRIGIDDEATSLVHTGFYRWVRHPIYTGVLCAFAGLFLVTPSSWTLAALVLGYVLIAIQTRLEDDHMFSQHGTGYASWASTTGRFFPGIGRWAAPARDLQ